MSKHLTVTSSKKKLIAPPARIDKTLSIDTSNLAETPSSFHPNTSRNPSQKENTHDYVFQKSNSLASSGFMKSISRKSYTPLIPSPVQQTDPFTIYPNTARNQNPSKVNAFVTRSTDFSKKSPEIIYKEHLFQTFQAVKFIRTLPQPEAAEINNKKVWLHRRRGYENKRTIVFDLDETLVHCIENPELGDFAITINLPTGQSMRAGVNIRPFAREVLASANRDFEVVVFTASHKCYADEVIDYLDPTGELIHHRLYRENCVVKSGMYIKDLRIFTNRRIEDIVIVDNSTYCFAYQLENGIPIISWFDDTSDKELYKLIEYIKILAQVPDIAIVNRHTFHLSSFYTDYLKDYLKLQDREI